MSVRIGQSVGTYRIVRPLGSGGMGAVYLAEHALIGKKVAVKVLHRELSQNREVVTRFFNEARAVNQIGNEHIVDINDFGQSSAGDHFFVMELLSGRSLADLLVSERRLPPTRALAIAAQIADALAAAHVAGVIHRDLKPENVYLIPRRGDPDFVKILDFGLAKLTDGASQGLTQAGVVLGTPQYMSPEQCESRPTIDARSDVYALGVLLYQMVTGAVPFDGRTMGEILVKHCGQPVPSPEGAPPAMVAIILRCLAKSPAERFPSMIALREELLAARRELERQERRRRRRRARRPAPRWPAMFGVVGIVAAIAAVAVVVARRAAPPEEPLARSLAVAPVPAAAPPAARDAPPAVAPVVEQLRVQVSVATEPQGAQIVNEKTGSVLGVTPGHLDLERGRELAIVLRLAGYEEKRQTVRADADRELLVELNKLKRSRRAKPRLDDDLLAPR